MKQLYSPFTRPLQQASTPWFIVYAGTAAFMTYVCMYAFRKPFTAATFSGINGWDFAIDFKTALLLSQVAGYALSKLIGIKLISEMDHKNRSKTLLLLVVLAEFALLALPLLPTNWKWLALFANGVPLGMVWGLVFSFLEGRKVTEAVGAILCASFIFGSGLVKSVGQYLSFEYLIPDLWMPFLTGALFLLPMLISVWFLSQVPEPSAEDKKLRQERVSMNAQQRWDYFIRYAPGLLLLILSYTLLTAFRDYTDNFSAELWQALGYGDSPEIFAATSLPITLTVLAVIFSLMLIKRNHHAIAINHLIIAMGFSILAIATLLFEQHLISGLAWMILINTGLYISYIPFNCVLFDRLVAATHNAANAGFLIYLADASGYLGSVAILLYKNLSEPSMPWVNFVCQGSYVLSIVGIALIFCSYIYFYYRFRKQVFIKAFV